MNKMYSSMRMRSTLAVVVAMFLITFSNHQCATAQRNCTSITSDQFSSIMNQHCRLVINSARNGQELNPNCCPRIRDLFTSPCPCSPASVLAVPNSLRDLVRNNCNEVIVPRELPRCPSLSETCAPVTEHNLEEYDLACRVERDEQLRVSSISGACCRRLRSLANGATCLCSSPPDVVVSQSLSGTASFCNNVTLTPEIRQCRGYN